MRSTRRQPRTMRSTCSAVPASSNTVIIGDSPLALRRLYTVIFETEKPSPSSETSLRRRPLEGLADQELERAEVALGEVLEPAPAGGDGGLGSLEAGDRAEQVLVVLAQLQLDGPGEYGIAGELARGAGAVAVGVDQGAEAQALEPLGHGAPVPAELSGARLHVEAVAPQAGQHRGVARLVPGLDGEAALRLRQSQVLALEHRAIGQRDGLAQAVLKLAHVAGPGVGPQRDDGVLGQRDARPAELGGGLTDDPRREHHDVVGPRAQRRQPEHQALEPEPEILAEPALGDAPLEVAVARGHDAHVHARRPRGAHPVKDLLLQHAQQLALLIGAQLADLVEEDRPAISLLEVAATLG